LPSFSNLLLAAPAAFSHVTHVVGLRSPQQMLWSDARWSIAGVANDLALREWAVQHLEDEPVRCYVPHTRGDPPVTLAGRPTLPDEALSVSRMPHGTVDQRILRTCSSLDPVRALIAGSAPENARVNLSEAAVGEGLEPAFSAHPVNQLEPLSTGRPQVPENDIHRSVEHLWNTVIF
jgi:hypothetical protein